MYSHHMLITIPYITYHKLFLWHITWMYWQYGNRLRKFENNWYSNWSDCSKHHLCAGCKIINGVPCCDASFLRVELSRGDEAMQYKHDIQSFPNNLVNVGWMRVWDKHHTCDLCLYCRVKVAVRCRPFNQRWELRVFDSNGILTTMFFVISYALLSNKAMLNLSLICLYWTYGVCSFRKVIKNIIDILSLG